MPLLLHAPLGALLAREKYGADDEAVLRAIARHTVGGASMTALDKIVYFADMVEPTRAYPGVEELRRLMREADLDEMTLAGLTRSIAFVLEKGHLIHPDTYRDIRRFEDKVCREMGLIDEIIPRYRTSYFNHIIASGYSAGYYSYLWSEVLADDAWEKFVADGVFNPETAKAFRQTFLEKGGSEEPMTLYRSFRGADPDPAALSRARGLE